MGRRSQYRGYWLVYCLSAWSILWHNLVTPKLELLWGRACQLRESLKFLCNTAPPLQTCCSR